MSRKNKFDLTQLVNAGLLKEGETLFFVSDPQKNGIISKQPNGEYKLKCGSELITVHAAAQKFLEQEPPEHASRWFRTDAGKILYELWKAEESQAEAA